VEHRHLLPNEIDLLVDGEVGFGTTPLKAHLRKCAECRAELEEARGLVRELEHLPHLAPSPRFANSVMAKVHVFVPWHVALIDTVRRWLPQSTQWRVAAAGAAGIVGMAITLAALWVMTRADILLFATNLAVDRMRDVGMSLLTDALVAILGRPALDSLRGSGSFGLALGVLVLVLAVIAAAMALRVLASIRARRTFHA
jgi:hypothetical protein